MDKLLNAIVTVIKLIKPDLHIKIGLIMLGFSVMLLSSFNLYIYYAESNLSYTDNSSIVANIAGIFLLLFSIKILNRRLEIEEEKKKFIFYFPGMKFNDRKFPKEYIPRQSKVNLNDLQRTIIDSYSKKEVIESFSFNKKNLEEQVVNENSTITYLAGLGSFPHLFLSGYLFNSGNTSNFEVFDFNRNQKKWYLLEEFGKNAKYILSDKRDSLESKMKTILNDEFNEVGIAIANSFAIENSSIPEHLREHTLFLEPNIGKGLDCCDNKATQALLLTQINEIIGNLSNKKKKIHLFVAARASFCINLGTYYMPRTYSTLVLHSYDNKTQTRNWAIQLENNGELS